MSDVHPDTTALLTTYGVLTAHVGKERMREIVDDLLNAGVVFRMADWWIAEQQPPAPTAGATGED